MKLGKRSIINKLDKVTSRAAKFALDKGYPLRTSKKEILVGNTIVKKSINGLYDVILPDNTVVYSNIVIFDVAIIIAQRYNLGETSVISNVSKLEERYVKYRNDMMHYLNCLKIAKGRRDLERMAILEDKFQVAEASAKIIRNNIAIFKRIK